MHRLAPLHGARSFNRFQAVVTPSVPGNELDDEPVTVFSISEQTVANRGPNTRKREHKP